MKIHKSILVIPLACFFTTTSVATNRFEVKNQSNDDALVEFRHGEAFYCDDNTVKTTENIIENFSHKWFCNEGDRACFSYKKTDMDNWSDWYSDDCDDRENSGSFN